MRCFTRGGPVVLMLCAVGLIAAPDAVVGQANDTIFACYVPSSGTMYRIRTGDLLENCSGPQGGPNAHVEFSWNIEGPQGPQGVQGPPGPPGAVPAGAMILWDQGNTCPDGFTLVTSYAERFLVAGTDPGTTGGQLTHVHDGGTFAAPPHRHVLEPWDGFAPVDDNSGGTQFNARTNFAGGGGLSGTSGPADSRPPFVQLLLCRAN